MTDERKGTGEHDERRASRGGIRESLGAVGALVDALEETIREARERGDLSPERAREVMRSALGRAQEAAEEARDRFDFAQRREVDELREALERLRERVEALEGRVSGGAGSAWKAQADGGEGPPGPGGGGEPSE